MYVFSAYVSSMLATDVISKYNFIYFVGILMLMIVRTVVVKCLMLFNMHKFL